ncbi:MAG: sialate O-acetylesterase, partial [bacterium]
MKKLIIILLFALANSTDAIGQVLENDSALQLISPVNYQVFQRFSEKKGTIKIEGAIKKGKITSVEINFYKKGEATEWKKINATITGRSFKSIYTTDAGGWYTFEIRVLNKNKIIAATSVEHVGIGEVFVITGQSNSANHGEEKQYTRTNLVSAFNGTSWQLSNDPQPGASGDGGSFIPPFADAIAKQQKVPVGIVACGIGATSVREWLPKGTRFTIPPTLTGRVEKLQNGEWQSKGEAFDMLVDKMKYLGKFGFRAVLWHQGESDANQPKEANSTLPGNLYTQYLTKLITESQQAIGWKVPWFTAMATYHVPGDEFSTDIQQAQRVLWTSGVAMEGPNTDELKSDMRDNNGNGVHFSAKGLIKHADLWVEKVSPWLNKELERKSFSKETPLSSQLFNIDGHVGFVIFPKQFNRSKPIPWVWYAPTLPGLPGTEELWMFEEITNAGIAIAGVDVGESYGSPDGRK